MYKNITYLFTLLLFSQVLLSQTKHYVSYWNDAKTIKKEEGDSVNGKREGVWILWSKSWDVYNEHPKLEEKRYLNGLLNGISKKWDDEGYILLIEQKEYKNGVLDGVCSWWSSYSNAILAPGTKVKEERYLNGVPHGIWKTWDNQREGYLVEEIEYKNGKRDGIYSIVYKAIEGDQIIDEDGETDDFYTVNNTNENDGYPLEINIKIEGSYKNDERHGTWIEWHQSARKYYGYFKRPYLDMTGYYQADFEDKKISEEQYIGGKKNGLRTYWFQNGQKKSETHYIDDMVNGSQIKWYKNGQKKEQRKYINGFPKGLFTSWYENGQKASEVFIDGIYPVQQGIDGFGGGDKYEGIEIKWHSNGQKKSEGKYTDGIINGIWKQWDENGKLIKTEEYKNGKLISTK